MTTEATKYGTTTGLVQARDGDHAAEQVYVREFDSTTHPIEIDGWVGWGSVGRLALTERQAIELARVLTDAVLERQAGRTIESQFRIKRDEILTALARAETGEHSSWGDGHNSGLSRAEDIVKELLV